MNICGTNFVQRWDSNPGPPDARGTPLPSKPYLLIACCDPDCTYCKIENRNCSVQVCARTRENRTDHDERDRRLATDGERGDSGNDWTAWRAGCAGMSGNAERCGGATWAGTRGGANVRHECELEQMRNGANVRHVASLWEDMRWRVNACLGGKICDGVRMCSMSANWSKCGTAQMCGM